MRVNYFWYDQTFRRTGQTQLSITNHAESVVLLTTGLRRQTVQGVVALAHRPDLTAECESSRGLECPAIGVNVYHADLHGRVVLGGDEAVCTLGTLRHLSGDLGRGVLTGGRALAGDVKVNENTL